MYSQYMNIYYRKNASKGQKQAMPFCHVNLQYIIISYRNNAAKGQMQVLLFCHVYKLNMPKFIWIFSNAWTTTVPLKLLLKERETPKGKNYRKIHSLAFWFLILNISKEEEKDRKIERQKLQTLKSKIIIKSRRKKTVEAKFWKVKAKI